MPAALDIAGPILEVLTWICLPAGLVLLLTVGFIRRFHDRLAVSEGVVYVDETGTGFRWFDNKYEVHNAPMSPHDIKDMAEGDAVMIYYDLKNPSRWQTPEPELHGKAALVLGRLLTGIGVFAMISGFVLPLF